jgi:hypothetical protein
MLLAKFSRNKRLGMIAIGIIASASLTACHRQRYMQERDIDITSKTTMSGSVNGSPIEVDVLATLNTGHGGISSCTFTKLPSGFNPATLGTHT